MSDGLSEWAKDYFKGLLPPPEGGNGAHETHPVSHARMGFSGADRWMACAASVLASEGEPDMVTPDARIGSAAHEVAANCLVNQQEAIEWLDRMVDLGDGGIRIAVDEMMVNGVQRYIDLVDKEREYGFNPDIVTVVEHRGSLERLDPDFFKVEPIYGTCDCRLYNRRKKRLTIIDLKYGYRFVSVEKPQTRGYAVMEMLSDELINEEIVDIELIIFQPRSPSYDGPAERRQVISVEALLKWATEEMLPAAKRAIVPGQPFTPGDHCIFCRHSPHCKALRQHAFDMAVIRFNETDIMPTPKAEPIDPSRLSIDQLARLLAILPNMTSWAKTVMTYALGLANTGIKIKSDDGEHEWKLVTRRGRRRWTPEDEQDTRLALAVDWGVPPEEQNVYKMASPAQLEVALKKIYGRKWRQVATNMQKSGLYETRATGVTLVPVDDTRPEVVGVELSMFERLDDD
jgi:hypothetical protein